jgi:hypothetical protein
MAYPVNQSLYGIKSVELSGQWATKYSKFPTDVAYQGSMNERIAELRRRGYGNDVINYWIINGHRLVAEFEAKRLGEIARLELKAKNDQIALNLKNKLESERIAKEQAEAKRLADVAEAQRLAAIEKEKLRIQLLEKQEKQKISVISSIIPLSIIAYLVVKK